MNELASAWEWFQVYPDLTANIVASFSQELRMVAQPKSLNNCDFFSLGTLGALLKSGV